MQPKWLTAQLEEFTFQSDFQSSMSETIHEELQIVERIGIEYSARLGNDVMRSQDTFERLKQDQQARLDLFKRQEHQANLTFQERESELLNAEDAVEETLQEQQFWEDQQAKANRWLTATKSRLNAANSELATAQSVVASATNEYNSAESAYNFARAQKIREYAGTDSKGNAQYRYVQNPAHAERARMDSARASLQNAKTRENNAIIEVNAAQREKKKAQNQVEGSAAAVKDTLHAEKSATSSLSSAQDAKSHTKDALHSLEKIFSLLELINETLVALERCVERQNACQNKLQQHNGNIINTLNKNEQSREELSYEVYKIRQVLTDKIKLLTVFDRPIFMG